MHLDNAITENAAIMPPNEGSEKEMSRQRHHVTMPDGSKRWFTGSSVTECFEKYKEACEKLQDQRQQVEEVNQSKDIPLIEEYAWHWFTTYKEHTVSKNEAQNERGYLNNHIVPYFGKMRIDEVQTKDIQAFYEAKKDFSISINEKCKMVLTGIFDSAVEDGHIVKSPMDSKRLHIVSTIKEERTPLTREQMRSIISELHKLEPIDQAYLGILIYTGIRIGEQNGLRWSDIDFDSELPTIHIERQATTRGAQATIKPLKSKAGVRFVPLVPELKKILLAIRPEDKSRWDEYVIGGKKPNSDTQKNNTWERIKKKVNL